ncbi:hypothetical protein CON36_35885 [Bacillus cereus]|uniref:Uncharacterized protein n=2 Tax=Bacillus cereus group TaxID=86661 RepID=A0A9X6SRV4_BACCE|nr:hypothetical protein [Bacillus cereus]PDZ94048.1 hypothetical protein CON36_35885 [Bacillus cereus]
MAFLEINPKEKTQQKKTEEKQFSKEEIRAMAEKCVSPTPFWNKRSWNPFVFEKDVETNALTLFVSPHMLIRSRQRKCELGGMFLALEKLCQTVDITSYPLGQEFNIFTCEEDLVFCFTTQLNPVNGEYQIVGNTVFKGVDSFFFRKSSIIFEAEVNESNEIVIKNSVKRPVKWNNKY